MIEPLPAINSPSKAASSATSDIQRPSSTLANTGTPGAISRFNPKQMEEQSATAVPVASPAFSSPRIAKKPTQAKK